MSGLEITLRDVYDSLKELSTQVSVFAGHLEHVNARLEHGQSKMADHETRLRALEKFRWQVTGALVVSNAMTGFIVWLLTRR